MKRDGPVTTPLGGLKQPEVTFYWQAQSGASGFEVAGTGDGVTVSKQFEVERPSVDMTAKGCDVGVGPDHGIFGPGFAPVCFHNGKHDRGMDWRAQVTPP